MALEIFAAAFEKRSLPPYPRVRWRGMVRCGVLATKARIVRGPIQKIPTFHFFPRGGRFDFINWFISPRINRKSVCWAVKKV